MSEVADIGICKNEKISHAYVGKHLTPRGGGVILKGLEGFRGGTQRVPLSKGGNPKIWPILGGESSDSGGRIGLKFSKGGEYFAKEYPSWRGGISIEKFSGGDIL